MLYSFSYNMLSKYEKWHVSLMFKKDFKTGSKIYKTYSICLFQIFLKGKFANFMQFIEILLLLHITFLHYIITCMFNLDNIPTHKTCQHNNNWWFINRYIQPTSYCHQLYENWHWTKCGSTIETMYYK